MSDTSSTGKREQPEGQAGVDDSGEGRRGFLAAVVSALVGLIPVGIGAGFFAGPLLRRDATANGDREFVDLGMTVTALPADGTPQLVTVTQDHQDAWNLYPNQPVGTVWLRRLGEQVIAYTTICPHLGCAIEHRAANSDFFCPCHNSTFNLDGVRLNQIPPRDMDSLEVKLQDGRVLVRYQNFRAGEPEKVVV